MSSNLSLFICMAKTLLALDPEKLKPERWKTVPVFYIYVVMVTDFYLGFLFPWVFLARGSQSVAL